MIIIFLLSRGWNKEKERNSIPMKRNKCIGIMLMFAMIAVFLFGGQSTYAATLTDGTYTVDYIIKKPDDESVSIANDYWNKPATVIVNGGAITVQMTINHSKWVTVFKVPSGNSFVDVKKISNDTDKDTRVVQFSVDSLEKDMLSQIHVTVPEINYDHDYTIRFVYDTNSLKLISQPEETAAPVPTSAVAATATPQPTSPGKSTITEEAAATTPQPSQAPKQSQKPTTSASTGGSSTSAKPTSTSNAAETATQQPVVAATAKPATASEVTSAITSDDHEGNSEVEINAETVGTKTETVNNVEEETATPATVSEDNGGKSELSSEEKVEAENNETDVNDETDGTVELSTALDGVLDQEAASVVSASVETESSNSSWFIIVSIIILLLVIGFIILNVYRKRNLK